jgi:hypothetical protein
MAKQKIDGVVEAVRYAPGGKIQWVRAYMRRGPTFSDRLLVDRQTLIEQLKAGKKYQAGRRVEQMASTFELSQTVRLIQKNGQDLIVTGEMQSEQDCLEGVPIL